MDIESVFAPARDRQEHPRIPTCTYRLQFNRQFTFAQAREIVPYLHALGVSDVYASPYFQASAESLHGYDITDHNKLNAAIGSRDGLRRLDRANCTRTAWARCWISSRTTWASASRAMNGGWTCSKTGPAHSYAPYFDIDWQPLKSDLRDKVLLPILGDQYGRVLERGELQVRFEAGTFFLLYGEHRLPIAPGTYRHILEIALRKSGRIQGRRFLRGIAKHLDRARIFAAAHRDRPEADRRTRAREGNHQAAAGASLRGSAAGATGDRKSSAHRSTASRATRAASTRSTNC